MDVREIDGRDTALARRFWEIGRDSEAAHRAYDFWTPWETAEIMLRDGRPGMDLLLLGAFEGEQMVGAGSLGLPLLDNLHLAYLAVHVCPGHLRRGIGSALVEAAEALVRRHGRRVVVAEACGPVGQAPAGQLFAESLGYRVAIEDGMKVLDVVETEPTWEALEAEVTGRSPGYRLVSWVDTVPEDLLEGYCRLGEAFNLEAPLGDLDLEAEVWSEERVHRREAENRAGGRHDLATAAVASDGTMVGLTEIVVNDHAPARGFQSGTLVLPDHRGHALGLAMKLANQRLLRCRFPGCRILMTGNAGVNAAMNAVNDKLGYRLVEVSVEMQRQL